MARNRGDIDAALTYFADNAVISQRNTTFSGKDDIRKFLEGVAARSRFIVVSDRMISGNRVTWTERSGTPGPQAPQPPQQIRPGATGLNRSPGLGGTGQAAVVAQGTGVNFAVTVDALVQDGKIQSLAYTFGSPAARPDPSLEGRAQLPAMVGLAAVLAVLLGVLMLASTGLGRATPVASTLQGRLMQDLQGWTAARD